MTERSDLPAGRFSTWLLRLQSAQAGGDGMDVPCGECTACCTSSFFVHIGPEETETLRRIPRSLLFPAPGLPKGNMVLGYDDKGRCPMLIDNRCSIYVHRPRTCRQFDCRVFPAAGLAPGDDKAQITQRVQRWTFAFPEMLDRDQHSAAQAAAAFLSGHAECFPDEAVPSNPLQLAILAIKIHDVFLAGSDASGTAAAVTPDVEVVKAALRR